MALTTKFFKPVTPIVPNIVNTLTMGSLDLLLSTSSTLPATAVSATSIASTTFLGGASGSVVYTVPSGRTARVIFNSGILSNNTLSALLTVSQSYSVSRLGGGTGPTSGALSQVLSESINLNYWVNYTINGNSVFTASIYNYAYQTLNSQLLFSYTLPAGTSTATAGIISFSFINSVSSTGSTPVDSLEYYLGPGESVVVSATVGGTYLLSTTTYLSVLMGTGANSTRISASLPPPNINESISAIINYFTSFIVIEEAAS